MENRPMPFDWQRLWLADFPVTYLGEVALRTAFMFVVILTALTISGKREVRQLSVYELVLLIGLGSAAGDPMFYHDVPLSLPVVVFFVVMLCYKAITRLSDKNRTIREKIEGVPVYVIENGCILTQNFDDEDLGKDELFVDLRQAGIEQLGQVRVAILEPNGLVSLYRQPEAQVKAGLPILPNQLSAFVKEIETASTYACIHCGFTQPMEPQQATECPICKRGAWVEAQS